MCECFTKRVPHASHADCLPSCVNNDVAVVVVVVVAATTSYVFLCIFVLKPYDDAFAPIYIMEIMYLVSNIWGNGLRGPLIVPVHAQTINLARR